MTPVNRARRTDAARNRERLLTAAELAFSRRGTEVSISEIAQQAGVAKATVFRHFATKDDLLVEVVRKHVDALIAYAETLPETTKPAESLLQFLTFAGERRQQYDVSFLIRVAADQPSIKDLQDRLTRAVDALVEHGQQAGVIRPDVTGADAILLICAPVHVAENVPNAHPQLWRRYLGIIFDGLRVEGAHLLEQPTWSAAAT